MTGIIIWAEAKNGELRKPALEAIQAAKLTGGDEAEIHAVVIGDSAAADAISSYPVTAVHLVEGDDYAEYNSEHYVDAIFSAVESIGAATVITAATATGRDLSGRLAARMDAALATDVTNIRLEDELVITRPVYSGKLLADMNVTAEKKVISIRPNTFDAADSTGGSAPINKLQPELQTLKATVKEAIASAQGSLDVTEADIIVAGGRGVGGSEGFELIEEVANALGGAVGASRTAVDEGWIPYKHQVGQTGKVVTPVLYIACGISGAIQHFAGMGSSKYIIAINEDEEAPIMKKADFAIVGDLFKVLPVLKEELAKVIN